MTLPIQVWQVPLEVDVATLAGSLTCLSDDECSRADRFAFAVHRCRFVVARAALRKILGHQLGIAAHKVAFDYSPAGKPELKNGGDVFFSVSHSNDQALIAVARGVCVGVDLEYINAGELDVSEMLRYFHASEQEAILALPTPLREAAFYRCWVRKEALLKALGLGLSAGLDCVAVSVQPEAKLLWADPALTELADWTLIHLVGVPGYAAALAVQTSADVRVQQMDCAEM